MNFLRIEATDETKEILWRTVVGIGCHLKGEINKPNENNLNFGAIITLRDMNGVNRIEEFIKACMLRGYIVNRLDVENRIEIFNSTQEEIRFD